MGSRERFGGQKWGWTESRTYRKAHTVFTGTYNLFTHTLDHVVNGNKLIFKKIFVFLYFWLLFLIIIGRVPAIFENTEIDF